MEIHKYAYPQSSYTVEAEVVAESEEQQLASQELYEFVKFSFQIKSWKIF